MIYTLRAHITFRRVAAGHADGRRHAVVQKPASRTGRRRRARAAATSAWLHGVQASHYRRLLKYDDETTGWPFSRISFARRAPSIFDMTRPSKSACRQHTKYQCFNTTASFRLISQSALAVKFITQRLSHDVPAK